MSVDIRSGGHHDCYDHYELRITDNLFNCDGCKMKGHGERYHCKLCRHELHIECRNPRKNISHEFFPGSTFTFHYKPFTERGKNNRIKYSMLCDACGKYICGFSYHCHEDKLDLHPCCWSLQKTLSINDTVFDLQANAKSSNKCIRCKKKKISEGRKDVPGWSYVSTRDKKCHFHVFCMTEMLHEACMKNVENVELLKLAKSGRRKSGGKKVFKIINIISRLLLGDPTPLISNVVVELVSHVASSDSVSDICDVITN